MTRHRRLLGPGARLALLAASVIALSAGCVGSPVPSQIGWTTLAWSDGVALAEGRFVLDLVPWGDGYVGVGGVDTGSGLETAFFTSGDGIQWTLEGRRPSIQSGFVAGVVAEHVVRVGNRLLAVGGAVMNAPGQLPDLDAPLWVSDDGTTWRDVHSATWDAVRVWPTWLLSGPQGVVAVRGGDDDAMVLHSLDGSTWTRATLPAAVRAIAKDAICWSGGYLIVGRDGQPDHVSEVDEGLPPGVGRPAAWISAYGLLWTQATVEGNEVAGAALSHVVADRAGFVAIGVNSAADVRDLKVTSWTSADGRTWSINPPLPFATTAHPVYGADGDRVVVFGGAPEGSGPAAWMTSDGVAWARMAFANSPAELECTEPSCLMLQRAWLVPDGVIVMGTPGPITPETFWLAEPAP